MKINQLGILRLAVHLKGDKEDDKDIQLVEDEIVTFEEIPQGSKIWVEVEAYRVISDATTADGEVGNGIVLTIGMKGYNKSAVEKYLKLYENCV